MIAKSRIRWLGSFVLVAAVSLAGFTHAAPPWRPSALFKKIEADPEKLYPVTDANGPWMILAVTFLGDSAEQQARELVYELRSEFKLPAYTHRMNFDYTGTVEGRGVDQFGEPLKMRYKRNASVDEIAVLVGDYPAVDDPEGQKVLNRLKYARPACLSDEKGEVARPLAGLREMQRMLHRKLGDERKDRGPLGHAFMATNPVLPPEYFVPNGPDNFVLEMNQDVEHSLLNCPGTYSIKVATFNGMTTIDPKKIKEIEQGRDAPSRLAQAALDAHKLTQALRAKGYEAYEYHDRTSSIVTVGSFDTLGGTEPDGTITINPQVEMIIKTFSADLNPAPGEAPTNIGKPKTLAGIPFDIRATAIEVPRRNISNDYERNTFGMR